MERGWRCSRSGSSGWLLCLRHLRWFECPCANVWWNDCDQRFRCKPATPGTADEYTPKLNIVAISGRARMRASVDALTGSPGGCSEAVLAQSRPGWASLFLVVGASSVLVPGVWDGPLFFVLGGVVAASGAFAFTLSTSYWVIGRIPEGVVIARSSRRSARALEISDRLAYPVAVADRAGIVGLRMTIDGTEYVIARHFERRFNAIVGRE